MVTLALDMEHAPMDSVFVILFTVVMSASTKVRNITNNALYTSADC